MADAVGLIVLTLLIALVILISSFIPNVIIPWGYCVVVYLLWLVCSLFVWHRTKTPPQPRVWLTWALYSVIFAPIWFGFAAVMEFLIDSAKGESTTSYIDIAMALMVAPGSTFIFIAGWVRALKLKKGTNQNVS